MAIPNEDHSLFQGRLVMEEYYIDFSDATKINRVGNIYMPNIYRKCDIYGPIIHDWINSGDCSSALFINGYLFRSGILSPEQIMQIQQ